MAQDPSFPYTWRRRRQFMFAVSGFCAAVIAYVLLTDMQSSVAETAVIFAFLALIGNVGSYVFGAAWQDVSNMRVNGPTNRTTAPPPRPARSEPPVEEPDK
ncbi:hypothetical protein ELZ22_17305 [Brucella abortus]|uniref:hypothetical protein n=1 Tax=Brucella abortus TaxID=235 RepID=UPI000F8CF7E2|nr:hypothetical protein [Brucella abortus]RUQ78151.1 hypothetical protein ELZ22_17305 [Brucella abortus]